MPGIDGHHTDWQPAFSMSKQQREAIHKWIEAHDAEKHTPEGQGERYSGAIGGAYTYCFTPTSLGTVVKVCCSCGDMLDASDYDEW